MLPIVPSVDEMIKVADHMAVMAVYPLDFPLDHTRRSQHDKFLGRESQLSVIDHRIMFP
jgi:hypothetical protein